MNGASPDGSFTLAQTRGMTRRQDRRDTRRTAVNRKGPLAWISATANRKDASRDIINHGTGLTAVVKPQQPSPARNVTERAHWRLFIDQTQRIRAADLFCAGGWQAGVASRWRPIGTAGHRGAVRKSSDYPRGLKQPGWKRQHAATPAPPIGRCRPPRAPCATASAPPAP